MSAILHFCCFPGWKPREEDVCGGVPVNTRTHTRVSNFIWLVKRCTQNRVIERIFMSEVFCENTLAQYGCTDGECVNVSAIERQRSRGGVNKLEGFCTVVCVVVNMSCMYKCIHVLWLWSLTLSLSWRYSAIRRFQKSEVQVCKWYFTAQCRTIFLNQLIATIRNMQRRMLLKTCLVWADN